MYRLFLDRRLYNLPPLYIIIDEYDNFANQLVTGHCWVIEFKYYSNSEFRKLETTIEAFQLQAEDTV